MKGSNSNKKGKKEIELKFWKYLGVIRTVTLSVVFIAILITIFILFKK